MSNNESDSFPITCPSCKQTGDAKSEENANPYRDNDLVYDLDMLLTFVSDGFIMQTNNKIKCKKCNAVFDTLNNGSG